MQFRCSGFTTSQQGFLPGLKHRYNPAYLSCSICRRRPTADDAAAEDALEVVSLRATELQLLKSSLRDSQKALSDAKDELVFRVQEAATKARAAVDAELKQLREQRDKERQLAAAEADQLKLKVGYHGVLFDGVS